MSAQQPFTGLALQSTVLPEGELELALRPAAIDAPGPGEVIVRIEAVPINPTDLSMLIGPADTSEARVEDTGLRIKLTPAQAQMMARRTGLSLCPGMEGAGRIAAAGPGCEDLIGRTVAMMSGGMFAQFRRVAIDDCILFPEGVAPATCAASFVNPLTVLGMIETMRAEGHKAIVHTAAASNLGQMLTRLCIADGIGLISVVRNAAQAELLRSIGATHVCDSSAPGFVAELTAMIAETGATLAFDAIGGGGLAATILGAMEAALTARAGSFDHYGSAVHKQVYIYGALDLSTIEIRRNAGLAWGVSGWLMTHRIGRLDPERVVAMKVRIRDEIGGIFASDYAGVVGLGELLDPAVLRQCAARSTGGKLLLNPGKEA